MLLHHCRLLHTAVYDGGKNRIRVVQGHSITLSSQWAKRIIGEEIESETAAAAAAAL